MLLSLSISLSISLSLPLSLSPSLSISLSLSLPLSLSSVMQSMMPGMGVLVMMFYGILHTWLNMWAELLRYVFCLIACLPPAPHWQRCACVIWRSATAIDSSTRTGGRRARFPCTTASGTWLCMSGCTTTCTRTLFGSWPRRGAAIVCGFRHRTYCGCVARFSLGKLSKGSAMALVFVLSAIVHEQIIACAIGTGRGALALSA